MATKVPDKQYFKIGEVAEIAGVAPSVLRFWESQFGRLKPEKSPTNQRRYSRKQLELVLEIKQLLKDRGFTIAGARRYLAKGAADEPSGETNDSLLETLKKEIRELLQLVDE